MFEAFVAAGGAGAVAVVVAAWAEEDEGDDPERSGFGTDMLLLLLLAGPRGNKSSLLPIWLFMFRHLLISIILGGLSLFRIRESITDTARSII